MKKLMITDLDNRKIWLDSKIIRANEAKIYALSPTAQYGLNVFEGIPIYYNKSNKKAYAFRLGDHYQRLFESARILELRHDYTLETLKEALITTVAENGKDEDLIVRQTLYADCVGSWTSDDKINMLVSPLPRNRIAHEYSQKGLKCCISSWIRINENSLSPRVKCGANYINSRMGQREALRNGYDTCIFINQKGTIAEAPGSCIFIIKDGNLITPEITDSVLASITRKTVIRIARDEGYCVCERSIDRTELYTCDEAFLCGSSMEIRLIQSIDGHEINGRLITNKFISMYDDVVRGRNNKYHDWLTVI